MGINVKLMWFIGIKLDISHSDFEMKITKRDGFILFERVD